MQFFLYSNCYIRNKECLLSRRPIFVTADISVYGVSAVDSVTHYIWRQCSRE